MKLKFTLLSILCSAFVFPLKSLNAQMVPAFPASVTKNTVVAHNSINAIIQNETEALNLLPNTFAYLDASRTTGWSGIGDQNKLTVTYPIVFTTEDHNLYFIADYSNSTSDVFRYNSRGTPTLGGSFFRLLNNGVLVPESAVTRMEMTGVHGETITKITSTQPYTHLQFEVQSATTAEYTRWLKVYSIFSVTGVYSAGDCGTPIAGYFESKINGVPLAGPVLNPKKIENIFDGDLTSSIVDDLAGVANIGDPQWHH